MRTSIVVAVVGVLALAAGGGYYGLEVYPQQRFRAGLDQTLATLPPGTTARYKDAHYSIPSGEAVVSGLTVHAAIPGDAPGQIDVTIDSIHLVRPNLDFSRAWATAAANTSGLTPATALPVADSVTLKGVTVRSGAVAIAGQSLHVSKPRLYLWALLHDGMPSWAEFQTSLAGASRTPVLAALRPILRAEAGALMGVGYDTYDAEATTIAETLSGIDIAYNVGKMSGGSFDRGVTQGGTVETVAIASPVFGTVSVDRVTIGPTDLRMALTGLVNGEAPSLGLLDGSRLGRISYDGIVAQPAGQTASHAGSVSIGPVGFAQGMPVSGEVAWKDVVISREQLPDATSRDAMEKIGLETMTVSFAASYDWNVAEKRMSLRDTMLKVNELGTVALSAELTNLAAEIADFGQARLAHARLRFDDASLVERSLRAGAAQSGTDPDEYRRRIVTLVRLGGGAPGQNSPALAAARQMVGDFITSPHSLTIELAPPEPVPVMALPGAAANLGRLATMLGLTASTNQQ